MGHMQRLEGIMRRAMQTWCMIDAGDTVCVGVSGGKDSVVLTVALHRLSRYYEHPFQVKALTLDPCFDGIKTDYSPVENLFSQLGIPYTVVRTDIGKIVFDTRKEDNPCALCAKLRRGTLHTHAINMGCNKIALGHHMDDAVETFYMNLFGGGRIGCFSPKTWLSQKQITAIRPMVLAKESDLIKAVHEAGFPVVKNRCPVDGETARAQMKEFVAQRTRLDPAFCQKTIGALQNAKIDGWAPESAR